MSIDFGKEKQTVPHNSDRFQNSLRPSTDATNKKDTTLPPQTGVARAAGVIGSATLVSRLLGAARDIAIASVFGAGMASDAFVAAFRVPNLIRRLFGEGSLSIAFVPVFSDQLYREGRPAADLLANSAIRTLALVLIVLVLVGISVAPWVVHILAPGFSTMPEKFNLTVSLTRTMMPYLFCVGLLALSMGILNVLGHFAAPALAPVLLNIAMIGAIVAGSFWASDSVEKARWLAGGVLAGGLLQLGLQLPVLIKKGIFFWRRGPLWHPAFKEILRLMGPVLFGAAVFQINSLVVTILASAMRQGSVSYLYYADRLVQFPLGLFGIATATAVLPTMARQSVQKQYDALRQTFSQAIRLVFFITLPSMVGLIVLRDPIVSLLFQRGAFDGSSARLTASALLYYGMGLWAFAAVRVVLNVFYAMKDTRTPVIMGILAVAVNLVMGMMLAGPMRHNGLALAVSVASAVNLIGLILALRRRLGRLD